MNAASKAITKSINGNSTVVYMNNGTLFYGFLGWGAAGTSPNATFPFTVDSLGNENILGNIKYIVGSDATNDMYYRNSSGTLNRIAAGTTGQVLTNTSGVPAWANAPGVSGTSGYMPKFTAGNTVGNSAVYENSGNVSIGTTDSHGFMFAVNGNAIATSVTVKLNADWPDYVFKPKYHLPTLTEVKTYIDKNQHLPDMPSEQDVAKDGINLGDMNKVLTKKVEELTLYLIEKDKQLTTQQQQLKAQEERLEKLEKIVLTKTDK